MYEHDHTITSSSTCTAKPPRIITHPKDLVNTVPGQQVLFTVQATGTKPLSYQWEYTPDTEGWSEEWQPCSGSNTDTLTIPSVQKSNKGTYHCVVSNCAGSQTSKPAKLEVSWSSIKKHSDGILKKMCTCNKSSKRVSKVGMLNIYITFTIY